MDMDVVTIWCRLLVFRVAWVAQVRHQGPATQHPQGLHIAWISETIGMQHAQVLVVVNRSTVPHFTFPVATNKTLALPPAGIVALAWKHLQLCQLRVWQGHALWISKIPRRQADQFAFLCKSPGGFAKPRIVGLDHLNVLSPFLICK